MTRASKCTPEVRAAILERLREGAFKKHAARAAGIAHQTLEDWLSRGANGEEPYASFAEEVERAIAEDAVRNQGIITQASREKIEGDWRAAAWNLEKKHPKLYGRLLDEEVITRVPVGPSIAIELKDAFEEARRRRKEEKGAN